MLIALTRDISPNMARCELTHLERQEIDVERAREQHRRYEEALAALGCRVQRLPAAPELPDSVFVEDTAVVLDEIAIITRPGAVSRRSETDAVAQALAPYRELAFIQAPGILDGGDVLCLGRELFVGLSGRSNAAAVEQMQALLAPWGYRVTGVAMSGCLHLKTAVTQAAELLLVNPAWVDPAAFSRRWIAVDPAEPMAANGLLIGDRLLYPEAYPRTRQRLEQAGLPLYLVDVTELAKAEGAVTCCSVLFQAKSG